MTKTWVAVMSIVSGCAVAPLALADIINVPGDQPTIQAGIDAAMDGDEVVVAPGSYLEAINFLGKAITLRSSDGAEVTTIDGTGNFHVVQCVNGEGSDTVLDGFVVTGGNANGDEFPDDVGGGMLNIDSSPTVTNCSFIGNMAGVDAHGGSGAGMYNSGGSPTVMNCSFIENTIDYHPSSGGGMCNDGSSPTVTNCSFIGNLVGGGTGTSQSLGGGMFNSDSSPTVTNCTFSGNSASSGAGMYNTGGSPTVTNCTFGGNAALCDGGGMDNDGSSPTVTNCSFIGNHAGGGDNNIGGNGGGMRNANASSSTVTNCSFVGNWAYWTGYQQSNPGGGMDNDDSSPTVTNCSFIGNWSRWDGMSNANSRPMVNNCIFWNGGKNEVMGEDTVVVIYSNVQGGYEGEGNIDADPIFVDPDNGDFRLSADSPCIDAADNSAVPMEIETDLDGNPRFIEDPNTPDTGLGDCPIVDMGSYEFQEGTTDCCPADFDNSGDVGVKDLLFLLGAWGPCPEKGDCPADFDDSGDVGVKDLLVLLGNWGPCP